METLNLASLAAEYSDESAARFKFEEMRWGKGCADVTCPHCGVVGQPNSYRVKVMPGSSTRPGLWRCRSCKGQFTVTKGTVFEDSHVPLTKWLLALYLLAASKKGMSAHQIHRMLKVKYQTAWFMMHRLRYAMSTGPLAEKLRGVVEIDETFIVSGNANTERKAAAILVASDRMIEMVRFQRPNAFCAHVRLTGHVGLMPDTFKNFPARSESQARTEKKYGPVITRRLAGLDRA